MNVNELKQKLNSVDTAERLSGLRDAIAESEALAVYVIKDYIKKEQSETILSAMIIACAKIGGPTEIDFIGSFLTNQSFKIQKYAFQSLLLIDSDAIYPYIFKALTENDVRLKQMAIRAIREIGKKKSLEIIETMLVREIEWQRKIALNVLELLNNILYENELIDILTRAISLSKKDFCNESIGRLKIIYDSGSEYACEAVTKLREISDEGIKKIVEENFALKTVTAETKEVKADSISTGEIEKTLNESVTKEKDDDVISNFSNYVDRVVCSKRPETNLKSENKSRRVTKIENRLFYYFKKIAFWPFLCSFKHKYKITAVLMVFVMIYAYVCPEIVVGKGYFGELKPIQLESLNRTLAQKGFTLNKDSQDSFVAYSHDYWTDKLDVTGSIFGKSVIFSAYEIALKNSEIFEAMVYFDKYGDISSIKNIKNLTETSSADEKKLIVLNNSFSYLSSADTGLKILTIQDGDLSNKRQFLFKDNIDISNISNSALAVNLIKVEAKKGENLRNVSLNVDSGNIDPPDFPVEYLPNIEADEPFVPRLVEKVRNLGFVGPEKIAKLEDFYYNITDNIKRTLYSGYEEEEDSSRIARSKAEGEISEPAAAANENADANSMQPKGINASYNILTNFQAIASNFADTVLCAGLETIKEKTTLIMALFSDNTIKYFKSIAAVSTYDALARNFKNQQDIAGVSSTTAETILADGDFPKNIDTLLKKNMLKNEGIWTTCEVPLLNGKNYAFKTKLRVDAKRSFAVMHFFCVDISKIDLHLMPGTNEPISTIGLKGKGVIPSDENTYQNLVCAFNGGFRTKHGQWGFIADGVSYVAPANGIATVAVDSKGNVKMGKWSEGFDTKENYVHLRQNLPPILENNIINMKHDYWGASIDNKTRVWRSALGVSRDGKWLVYGAGNSLSHDTLATGMSLAGCDFAMQLDINDYHTYLYTYKPNGTDKKGGTKVKAVRLTDEMAGDTVRCINPYTRDFFYVTWKTPLIQTAKNQ